MDILGTSISQSFNEMVTSQLKSYVYALADPRKDVTLRERVFYIGKGKENRCFNHANLERTRGEHPLHEDEHKLARIREIHQYGKEVEVLIVAHGMSDEAAHDLEAVLIPLLGDTNRVAGHGNTNLWLSKNQINEAYDQPIERADVPLFRGNILIVNLNEQDVDSLLKPENEWKIAEQTLGNWVISREKSTQVECIVGVKNGLIVSIFETLRSNEGITEFVRLEFEEKHKRDRSRFEGTRRFDLEKSLRGRSVYQEQKLLSKMWPGAGCKYLEAMTAS